MTDEQAEEIIVHSTYTEDKLRFRKWIENCFKFAADDIKYVSGKRYTDFGRLSKKLLSELEGVCTETGEIGTVMHFMWNTNDNLMQIIADENKYNFSKLIRELNEEYYLEHPMNLNDMLDGMGVSNAVKRPILRTIEIMSDIVKASGSAPKKIFVEMPRGAACYFPYKHRIKTTKWEKVSKGGIRK